MLGKPFKIYFKDYTSFVNLEKKTDLVSKCCIHIVKLLEDCQSNKVAGISIVCQKNRQVCHFLLARLAHLLSSISGTFEIDPRVDSQWTRVNQEQPVLNIEYRFMLNEVQTVQYACTCSQSSESTSV